MATVQELLKAFERQRQILNELSRTCAKIEQVLTGKLAEREKARKGDYHELIQTR